MALEELKKLQQSQERKSEVVVELAQKHWSSIAASGNDSELPLLMSVANVPRMNQSHVAYFPLPLLLLLLCFALIVVGFFFSLFLSRFEHHFDCY